MDDQSTRTTEVRDANVRSNGENVRRHTVTTRQSTSPMIVVSRIVWWIAGLIIAFIGLRVLLQLLGANQGSPFVDFIYTVGGFFAAPFFGMFNYQPSYGNSFFELSSVVAMVVYALVAWGIVKLLTIASNAEV